MPDVQHQSTHVRNEYLDGSTHTRWRHLEEDKFQVEDLDTGKAVVVVYGEDRIVPGVGRVKEIKEVRS